MCVAEAAASGRCPSPFAVSARLCDSFAHAGPGYERSESWRSPVSTALGACLVRRLVCRGTTDHSRRAANHSRDGAVALRFFGAAHPRHPGRRPALAHAVSPTRQGPRRSASRALLLLLMDVTSRAAVPLRFPAPASHLAGRLPARAAAPIAEQNRRPEAALRAEDSRMRAPGNSSQRYLRAGCEGAGIQKQCLFVCWLQVSRGLHTASLGRSRGPTPQHGNALLQAV